MAQITNITHGKTLRQAHETGKTPPHNLEAEQSILGGLLISPEAMDKIADIVKPDHFYRVANSQIYEIMFDLYNKKEPIDIVTVYTTAKDKGIIEQIGGATYLSTLIDLMPSTANIAHYAKMVRENAILRKIVDVGAKISEKGYTPGMNPNNYIEEATKIVSELTEDVLKPSSGSICEAVKEFANTIEALYKGEQSVSGLPTGYTDLDEITGGLQPSDLIVVAGRPSMGKTALCLNIAQHVAKEGGGVAIFSLEMSTAQLIARFISSDSEIEQSKFRTGKLSEADWGRFGRAGGELSGLPIYINDSSGMNVLEVSAQARKWQKEHGLSLLIVDYLQLMQGRKNGERREQEISEISRSLKGLAKELNIPVIAVSQLNRGVEQREDRRPRISDLRESGAIEQDADVILLIYRNEVYNKHTTDTGTAEIIVGKQRNGPIGMAKLTFFPESATFGNHYVNTSGSLIYPPSRRPSSILL